MQTEMDIWVFFSFLLIACCTADKAAVDKFLNRCLDSKSHKKAPGREFKGLKCQPWNNYSCCTTNTTVQIETDGVLSLYSIIVDQCPQIKKLSAKCRKHFHRDNCFYECSPNYAPWIVEEQVSKKVRRERVRGIPLCASDCDQWFHDCIDDYTCNDNWGKNWDWSKKGTTGMCTKPCKTFKEYFGDPVTFCKQIFNFSYKYTDKKDGCMTMWPDTPKKVKSNREFAEQKAKERLADGNSGVRHDDRFIVSILTVSVMTLLHLL